MKLYFVRDVVNAKKLKVEDIDTSMNAADMFTKALSGNKFDFCVGALGIG